MRHHFPTALGDWFDCTELPEQTRANVSIISGQIGGLIVKGNSCSEETTS